MKDIVIPTLKPEDIEVKVKKVGKSGTQVLLYKTARTDMEYLDKIFGIGNWTCDYKEIKGNLYCTISIWDEDKNQWIPKVDCGTESREDGEGNEKKGEASDAFKRAGFKIGIGRELYSTPFVFIKASDCPVEEKNGRFYLKDAFTKFAVSDIGYDENRKINKLVVVIEQTGAVVYRYGVNGTAPKKATSPKQEAPKATAQKPVEKNVEAPKLEQKVDAIANASKPTVTTASKIPSDKPKPQHEILCEGFINKHKIDKQIFASWRADAVKAGKPISSKRWNDLTEDEWVTLLATMEALWEEGFFGKVA